MLIRAALIIKGIVQGVGFRPYIFRLATQHGLRGYVRNAPIGVLCEVEGDNDTIMNFIADIPQYKPFAAHIDSLDYEFIDLKYDSSFQILPTIKHTADTGISPDLAICDKCRSELFDPDNKRYQYPFINCTACGPRYSIIENMPYDRQNTVMSAFDLCPECQHEYENAIDRRFHAEPNACPICGPEVILLNKNGNVIEGDWPQIAAECLYCGGIIAIKGIGGYHLAAAADNRDAIAKIRSMKGRYVKPFALMMRNIDIVKKYCHINASEEKALKSKAAPIVLLKKKSDAENLADNIAAGKSELGIMLPYTPLHCILTEYIDAFVLTSANISNMPICCSDEEIINIFDPRPDMFIQHNRTILHSADDSLIRIIDGKEQFIRRSRGYVPAPISYIGCDTELLALGAEQKNTFALSKDNDAFMSVHIGELSDYAAYCRFEDEIAGFGKLLNIKPQKIICDMHPDYHYSRFLSGSSLPIMKVQHHHAHFASVLAENDHKDRALGIIWDGTGYGLDGKFWGSEFLIGDLSDSKRAAHLLYFPLLGGEKAIYEPWRLAMAMLDICGDKEIFNDFLSKLPDDAELLLKNKNWPYSCGMGRLCDAVAAILCDCHAIDYDGQAAEILEEIASNVANTTDLLYKFDIIDTIHNAIIIDWRPVIINIYRDKLRNIDIGQIALAFHNALIQLAFDLGINLMMENDVSTIALSGGCFLNKLLLKGCIDKFKAADIKLLLNEKVPCNDGGIAYGQLSAAAARICKEEH